MPPPTSTAEPVKKKKNTDDDLKFADVDPNKVIFLDVDGVMRPAERGGSGLVFIDGEPVMSASENQVDFLPSAMRAIRKIAAETGARIVISSEWRKWNNLRQAVWSNLRTKCKLMPNRFHSDDQIPALDEGIKGDTQDEQLTSFAWRRTREIDLWLKRHPNTTHWVALDDVDLPGLVSRMTHSSASHRIIAGKMSTRGVITHPLKGLTETDAEKAVSILMEDLSAAPEKEKTADSAASK